MLRSLLLAVCLIQIAQSTYVESNPQCTKGPSYWCQSIKTSQECNAFNHCLQTIWTKHDQYLKADNQLANVNNPNPNSCTNCLQCVDARVNYCPYVKNFADELDQMRAANLPPTTICKLLEQCDQHVNTGPLTGHGDGDVAIDARFECGLHPRHHCDNLETAHKCSSFDRCLREWMKQPDNKYVLDQSSTNVGAEQMGEKKTCGFCIFLFDKLHSVLELNETEIDIEQYLMGACSLLPTKGEADLCNDAVQKYLPEIIQMVRNNMDPGIICRVLKLCDDKFLKPIKVESPVSDAEKLRINKELREFAEGVKVKVLNAAEAIIETPLSNEHQNNQPHLLGSKDEVLVATLKQSMGVGCELCQIVLSAAKHLIENKVDDQKVLAFIDKQLCSRLGAYKTACSDYLKLEGEQILKLLRNAVDPALICEMMGFCLKVQVSNERIYDLNLRNSLNCTLCKMVFAEVKKKLSQHEEEERIISYINKNLCEKVGKSKEMCKTLIEAYGPLFLEIIARDVNPEQLCDIIGMCSKQQQPQDIIETIAFVDIQPAIEVKSNQSCVICEFVINLLSQYISQNTTEPEVEKLLEMICNKIMPSTVQPQCNEFIKQYGPAVISLIVNGMKPDQVCRFIGLCAKTSSIQLDNDKKYFDEEHLFKLRSRQSARIQQEHQKQQEQQPTESKASPNQTIQCSLCIYVAELIDTQLKQNKTEEQITREIELVCNLFPNDLKDQCKSFLDEYMPYILQLVAAELDAETTCAALKLCNKKIENDIFRRTFVNKLPTK